MSNFTMSEFYCTKCGKKNFDIPRRKGREREAGHLKKLYCINCKEEHNCVEIKPFSKYGYEDFKIEYEYGNFSDNGDRIRPYGKLKEMIHNGEIEKTKTLASLRSSWLGQDNLDSES